MKKSKSILQDYKLINLIGIDAHIMLCEIKYWLEIKNSCRILYMKWKKVFPFWTFKRYIKTKKYLIKNKFIYKDVKNNYYVIGYSKIKELIQEV